MGFWQSFFGRKQMVVVAVPEGNPDDEVVCPECDGLGFYDNTKYNGYFHNTSLLKLASRD